MKLNILETCIFFHLNKLGHSNAWSGTASIYIYIYIYSDFAKKNSFYHTMTLGMFSFNLSNSIRTLLIVLNCTLCPH